MTSTRRDFLRTTLATVVVALGTPKILKAGKSPQLFERTQIKTLKLPNRSIRSSTWTGTADKKGYVTERTLELYGELAKGELGLILTGYTYVLPNGQGLPYMKGIYDDSQIDGMKNLADAVHKEGGKIAVQLAHCLSRANPKLFPNERDELWGASAVALSPESKVPKEMTQKDIAVLVEAHAKAATRSLKAGFDGIQLHPYGINQFLSPYWNRRGDAYGGSLQNRYRIVGEIIEAIRGSVGKDYPLMAKINTDDAIKGGLDSLQLVDIAGRLADDTIDAIQVGGSSAIDEEVLMKELGFAQQVRDATKIPVIAVGGIRSLDTIRLILSDRKLDYISMARPLVREPHLISRWKNGDTVSARCISCNQCRDTGLEGLGISCYWERKISGRDGDPKHMMA
jgi:2,4-dienoyl-CoA reductase-like NADH-dependent reductase (Old Yellow Enzyme family)